MNNNQYHILDGANVFRKYFYLEPLPEHLEKTLKEFSDVPNTIWVFDGLNSPKKRKDIFPEYKAKRKSSTADDLAMFDEMNRYKNEIIPSWGVPQLEFPEWEADDIIYNLVKFLPVASVRTTDKDFWQMCKVNPNLLLPETTPLNVEHEEVILYKTLVGDTSDNISGVKGFGNKAWEKLSQQDKFLIETAIKENAKQCPTLSDLKVEGKMSLQWEQLKIFYKLVSFIEINEVEFEQMILSKL